MFKGSYKLIAKMVQGLALLLCAGQVFAADLDVHQVKARYIYNFIKYITWPDTAATAFQIGVLEESALKTALDEVLKDKNWQGKPYQTLAVDSAAGKELHLVYVRETNRDRIAEILKSLPRTALTIGEGPSFLARGGMIEFNLSEGKVRFSVNLPALREAGLAVDPKLLVAAQEVRK